MALANGLTIAPGPATLVFGFAMLVSHGFGLSLVPAMLPRIEEEFQSGYGVLGVAVATGLLAYALGSVLASPIMKLVSTRGLLIATLALTGVGFVVTGLASSPVFIAVAVVLMGISAPISWTAVIHIVRETVSPASLSIVSAGASGGATFGFIVNGVLVQTSGSIHTWRASFFVAAIVTTVVIVMAFVLVRQPVPKPDSSGTALFAGFRDVLADPSGRMIIATSGIASVALFTLATFLTATAIDEMGASDTATALLLGIAGLVGVGSAFGFGRFGDRRTPILAITAATGVYAATLTVLAGGWSYPVLVAAVIGLGIMHGPVWGLMSAIATRRFSAELAITAISLGLIAASILGAIGNSITGVWIENTGSMRGPVVILAVITIALTCYLIRETRRVSHVEVGTQESERGPPGQ